MKIHAALYCIYLFFIPTSRCFGENMLAAATIQANKSPLATLDTDLKKPKEYKSSGSGFVNSYASSRLITPNGDGKNDTFIFRYYNPKDSAVTGRIFTLSGAQVAEMKLLNTSPAGYFYDLEWNPNSGSEKAPGGVYIYQIEAENSVYTGTIVVIR